MKKHKVLIKRKFLLQWEKCFFENVHDEFYKKMIVEILRILDATYDPRRAASSKDQNVFLREGKSAGKTMAIKVAVLEWANDKIWKDVISYIVYLTSYEINQMANSSLVELMSRDWPNGQAPIADILSDSQKLLFILEDLDNIEVNLNIDESALCSDSRQQVSVSVLLASLLKRKMAPGSSFLISSRTDCDAAMKALVKEMDYSITLEFSNEKRQKYFTLFFRDSQRAMIALKLVRENEMFLHLCQEAVSCWITCIALNRQMDNGDDMTLSCQRLTDIYVHFLANTLTSEAGVTANHYHLILLECLCSLALEGLFHDTQHFSDGDLRSVGFTEADVSVLQALKILLPSSSYQDHYMFIHLKIQEFCAAMAYMMVLTECRIPSASKRYKDRRQRYNEFSPIITSIFGLLNEKRRKILENSLGCHLLTGDLRQYFLQKMKYLGNNPKAMEHHIPLFYCLFENQEEEFVKEIMDCFLEATIYIQKNEDLMVSSYCLKRYHPLQKLKLCIQCIFENKDRNMTLNSSKMRSLVYWKDFCSLLYTKENLWELEICNSDLDDTSERVLCKALIHPSCQLQTLKLTYLSVGTKFEDVFKAIVYNQNLMLLSLNCMPISLKMFPLLHEVLDNLMCSTQHLRGVIALLNARCSGEWGPNTPNLMALERELNTVPKKFQTHLGHSNCLDKILNELFNEDLFFMDVMKEVQEHLPLHDIKIFERSRCGSSSYLSFIFCRLSGCFFTSDVCRDIASAITNNPNLRSLELGSNNIGDAGMELLCNALKHPNCNLENIGLEECMLTSACCESLASVLISSKTLKKLNLFGNELGDEGIMQILEGLGHPDCILQTVGLQINDIDAETRKLLMTVKEKNTKLVFVYQSWAKKEGREVSEKLGDLSLSQSVPMIPNLTWHLITFHMPRKFRLMKSTTVSEQHPQSCST
ncbi:hypothetical protein HPG69_003948 [Diceros bicornis minor]|uniref:NACHT domain-containing protein n=1 Tax=Diceros bicornis minor TaxID=77932 RepID=A0A7J7EEM3_DICBM|nr:hypothetical protein HPG69_003948 [Diceros bicornis minor]